MFTKCLVYLSPKDRVFLLIVSSTLNKVAKKDYSNSQLASGCFEIMNYIWISTKRNQHILSHYMGWLHQPQSVVATEAFWFLYNLSHRVLELPPQQPPPVCVLTVISQNANEVYHHQRIQLSFMATQFNIHLPRAVTQAVKMRREASKGSNRMATGAAPACIKGSRMGLAYSTVTTSWC